MESLFRILIKTKKLYLLLIFLNINICCAVSVYLTRNSKFIFVNGYILNVVSDLLKVSF